MSNQFKFRTLKPSDIDQMYQSFLEAFSQYSIDMKMPKEVFQIRMIERLNICWEASPAVFVGDKLVGFIFHAVGDYQGEKVAYDGGTGVIPGYWGHGLTGKMYDYILPTLKKMSVHKGVLEVISTNEKGIRAYEKIGFENNRLVKCFKLESEIPPKSTPENLSIDSVTNPNLTNYSHFTIPSKCYGDQMNQMPFALKSETVLEARMDDELAGYVIFQHRTGRLSQLAVSKKFQKMGIGTTLLRQAQALSLEKSLLAINIEASESASIEFFEACGFKNKLDQWEMVMDFKHRM